MAFDIQFKLIYQGIRDVFRVRSLSYKNLIVWQDSRRLNREIYNLAFKFPRFELYALSDQLRRACVSVTSNIAEGYGQGSLRNRLRYLYMARGSLYETETQLLVAVDLGFVNEADIQAALNLEEKIAKMLNGLIRANEERIKNGNMGRMGEDACEYGARDILIPNP